MCILLDLHNIYLLTQIIDYKMDPQTLTGFIEDKILPHIPEAERIGVADRVRTAVRDYGPGWDVAAVSLLSHAANAGRFEEFYARLEVNHTEELSFVHPDARRIMEVPAVRRTDNLFRSAYKELGISLR